MASVISTASKEAATWRVSNPHITTHANKFALVSIRANYDVLFVVV